MTLAPVCKGHDSPFSPALRVEVVVEHRVMCALDCSVSLRLGGGGRTGDMHAFAAMLGMTVSRLLPEHERHSDANEIVQDTPCY